MLNCFLTDKYEVIFELAFQNVNLRRPVVINRLQIIAKNVNSTRV